ncbi:MAG: hypothetical protein HFH91_16865 [Lachnospiraceae bacterium]|nr:hypothetical protein [Lachnospiraceae bacterium]
MSETTMEQKLQLVKQVRSRYHENQYDLSNRERILYGRTSASLQRAGYLSPYEERYGDYALPEGQPFTFFKLRLWLALFLVTAVILLDLNGAEVAGITSQKIFEVISADYEEVIETWVENLQ